jgi:hypothetical protein
MPEEINHARRFLLSTFFAGSAITIAAADLGIIGPADARTSKNDLAGATPIQLPTQTQRKDHRMEHTTLYRTMQIDGLSIFYREAGPKDAPTLLLLHGLPSSSRMFEPLFARLSDSFHLVAPDYAGFGHSDWPDRKNLRIPSITSPRSWTTSPKRSDSRTTRFQLGPLCAQRALIQ